MIKTKQLLLLSTLAVMAGAASAQSLETATLYINGSVVSETCAIEVADVTVNLPDVSVTSFAAANDTAGLTPFQITANCASSVSDALATGMNLAFTPMADTTESNFILKNLAQGSDGATGVGVRLLAAGATVVNLRESVGAQGFEATAMSNGSGVYTWDFDGAEYIALAGGTVTPGRVTAQSVFTVSYD